MLVEGTIPVQEVATYSDAPETAAAAVKRFRSLYPTGRIEKIDGRFVRGICAGCETPVMEDEQGHTHDDESGAYTCSRCAAGSGTESQAP